jgi:hypothetical protein
MCNVAAVDYLKTIPRTFRGGNDYINAERQRKWKVFVSKTDMWLSMQKTASADHATHSYVATWL